MTTTSPAPWRPPDKIFSAGSLTSSKAYISNVRFSPESGHSSARVFSGGDRPIFEESSLLCELPHIETQRGQHIIRNTNCHVHDYRERQMSHEFDRSYTEEVIMLSALALFLVLAVVIPS